MGNDKRPNQLLIVSDEERRNDWLHGKLEWYQPADDPHELINLANDVGRKGELREHFNQLLEIELAELGDKAGHQGPS